MNEKQIVEDIVEDVVQEIVKEAHTVETFTWEHGRLKINKYDFDCLEDAYRFAESFLCEHCRIFNSVGQIVHHFINSCYMEEVNQYA